MSIIIYSVVLDDNGYDTVGDVSSDDIEQDGLPLIGKIVTAHLHDENGIPIQVTGRVVDVIQERTIGN